MIQITKIKNTEYLFDEINEDYYKPVKSKGAFNDNYMEYESRGDKDKNLSPEEYLDMIRPYLRDMINNHKTPLKILWAKYLIIIFMENGKFS